MFSDLTECSEYRDSPYPCRNLAKNLVKLPNELHSNMLLTTPIVFLENPSVTFLSWRSYTKFLANYFSNDIFNFPVAW